MTLAAQITDTGITAPTFQEILDELTATFQSIYGSDAYLGPDSQDGQLLATIASAINDANQTAIKAYQDRSPAYAQGVGLDSVVKINGLIRRAASYSTVNVTIAGVVGTIIANGVVQDTNGNKWDLPASVTIPISGSIVVTATAQEIGDISAAISSVTSIVTPVFGWQSVTNATAAAIGAAVETDAQLRARQSAASALPARSLLNSLIAAIAAVSGVTRSTVYENDTGSTDANGVPAHSVSPVVEGGDVTDIGNAIALIKPPGIQTYGTTDVTVTDEFGLSRVIHFFVLNEVAIYVKITIVALAGYTSATGAMLMKAVVQWINSLSIGEDVYIGKLYGPANLNGDAATFSSSLTQAQLDVLGDTFNVSDLRIGLAPAPTGTTNLAIAFNEAAACEDANVTLIVT